MIFSNHRIQQFKNLYYKIINNAKIKNIKTPNSYFEQHHIIPKCIGGTNKKNNIVLLTAREHFICHWLLARIYDDHKIIFAFFNMCNKVSNKNQKRDYKVNSNLYEITKIQFSKSISGENNPNFGKGLYGKDNPNFGKVGAFSGKKHNKTSLEKMRKPKSPESKQNYSKSKSGENNPNFGKPGTFLGKNHSPKTKEKMSLAYENRIVLICPHCKFEGKQNMKRYHFDNCKFKNII